MGKRGQHSPRSRRCTGSGEGFSKLFSVDASCDGTASGCAFKIVPKAATAAAATATTK